ncbi:MAG: DUF2934 domain-containing protein [Chlorobiaceae bacterium]|nr:DUF2934 domain-containing protein [Chlorobiaceae bacterium]
MISNETDERKVSGQEQSEEAIRLSAYYLWELKGSEHGSDVDHWLEAEEALKD